MKFSLFEDSYTTLSGFLDVINLWKKIVPGSRITSELSFNLSYLSLVRASFCVNSFNIAKLNEIILDLKDKEVKEEYENKIDKYINECISFKKIKCLKKLSDDEKRQKFKNALAHCNYQIIYDENDSNSYHLFGFNLSKKVEGSTKVMIKTEFIECELDLIEFSSVVEFYKKIGNDLYNKHLKEEYVGLDELLTIKVVNFGVLKKAVDKIKVKKDGKLVDLDLDKKNRIINYLHFVRLQNWICIDKKKRKDIFDRVIVPIIDNSLGFNDDLLYYSVPLYLDGKSSMGSGKNIRDYLFDIPVAYVSSVLSTGFFCFNYLKEAAKKEEQNVKFCKDFDLKGVKCVFPKKDNLLKVCNNREFLVNELDKAEREEKKYNKKFNELNVNIESIRLNDCIPDDKKEKLIKNLEINLDEVREKLDDVSVKIPVYKEMLNKKTDYVNCSNFFKHLRNSFSHGFIEIDYNPGLKSKNVEDIVFIFKDYNIDKDDREKRNCVFHVEMTGDVLIRIINALHDRLCIFDELFDENKDTKYFTGTFDEFINSGDANKVKKIEGIEDKQ